MTGYKKMISDRIPKVWDMTIRWCKCRQRWIDLVYDKNLKALNTNCMSSKDENNSKKSRIVKNILNPQVTKFEDSIHLWKMIQYRNKDYEFWQTVCKWEKFFSKYHVYWKNFATLRRNEPKQQVITELSEQYNLDEDLASFVINSTNLWA